MTPQSDPNQANPNSATGPAPVGPTPVVANPAAQNNVSSNAPVPQASPLMNPATAPSIPVEPVQPAPADSEPLASAEQPMQSTDLFADTTSTNQPVMDAGQGPNKPKKRWLKVVLLVVAVVAFVGAGAFAYLRSQKTSVEALKNFSNATSTLNSKASKLTLNISYANTSSDDELQTYVTDFDSAVKGFEEAASKLKSDRESLKKAADTYVAELKSFSTTLVPLAVDTAKVEAVGKKMSEIAIVTSASSSEAAFLAEFDRVSGEYSKYSTELKELELTNNDAKELRDAFVSVSDQLVALLAEARTAFVNRDRTALLDVQNKMSKLERDNAAITKEDEIDEKLSGDGEVLKKVDNARKTLNEEITKVNAEAY